MSTFSCFKSPEPVSTDMLVSFFDMTGFARSISSSQLSETDLYALLASYYEFIGDIIEPAGGMVLKFMGDAALVVFPAEKIEAGVMALARVKEEGDLWLNKHGLACKNIVKVHYGTVAAGLLGTKSNKRPDILGQTVNTTALMESRGFAVSPQVFRKLSKDARTLFKKHTPPITYIPVNQKHRF
ncbi:MAG: adenylate/guanylate cyclase domain-containing protein [Candidatus Rifleibacteriota bacterium]